MSLCPRFPLRHIRFRFDLALVVIRRCNLSCGYCSEYDKFSDLVPAEVLEKRLLKFKELGTFGISLTGGDAPYS
jgi:molybdenum cofactor biosynthesis enzyme MoaA